MMYKRALELVEEGINSGLYTGAALGIIRNGLLDLSSYHGLRSDEAGAEAVNEESLFDLASLTKIVSTTSITLRMIEAGIIRLDDPVKHFFPNAIQAVSDIRIRELLTHRSIMPAHFLLEDHLKEGQTVAQRLTEEELPSFAKKDVEYSCMGFILLGEILKQISGISLEDLFRREVLDVIGLQSASFKPQSNCVKTRDSRTDRLLDGIVHDENARIMRAGAANAGLFSNLSDLLLYAEHLIHGGGLLLSPAMLDLARQNHTKAMNEDRGLGFFLATNRGSSFGDLAGAQAYGHTGFTGTSIIIQPETKSAVVLLTNRVISDPNKGNMVRHRALIHNSIFAEMR